MTRKILVCGNHTCGNRGDAAILRGLLTALTHDLPDADFTVTSRYPTSSSHLLGRPVVEDLYTGSDIIAPGRGRTTRRRLVPWTLMAANRAPTAQASRLLSAGVQRRIETLRQYDLVVQLGGSYYVDLYGYGHFETGFSAVQANVPWILLGHSIGPIAAGRYPLFVRHLLERAAYVGLRETVSRDLLADAGLPMNRVHLGADTAWNIDAEAIPDIEIAARYFGADSARPIVALTARELAPFDRLLGVTQAEYEAAFARLADTLIEAGYNVLALSTCTGIDSYHRDDRMVALRIGERVQHQSRFAVVMDELTDLDLGAYLRACRLLVATRLHSAIIAMNFGTPALALAYEHKSTGILRDMNLDRFNCEVAELIDGRLTPRVLKAADEAATLATEIAAPVAAARSSAQQMVSQGLRAAGF